MILFESHKDDWVIQWLNKLFYTENILSKSIATFNTIFVYLFAFFAIILILSTLLNGAAQGRLQPRGTGLWMGLRLLLSLLWIAPIHPQGYCTAQVIAISCMKIGSRGATLAWETALEQMKDLKPLIPASPPQVNDLAYQLFTLAVCTEAQNHPASPLPKIIEHRHEEKDRYVISLDGDPTQGGITAQCGAITYLKGDLHNPTAQKILQQHIILTNKLRQKIKPLAKSLVNAWMPLKTKAPIASYNLPSLFEVYTQGIAHMAADKLTPSQTQRQNFYQEAKKGGWAFAGAWAYQFSLINGAVYSALDSLPTVQPPHIEWWSGALYHHHHWVFEAAHKWWRENEASARALGDNDEIFSTFKEDSILPWFDFARHRGIYDKILISEDSLNPIDKMVSLGHAIINTAWGAMAAKSLADAALEGTKKAAENQIISWLFDKATGIPSAATSGAQAALNAYGPLFYLGLFSLFSGGVMLAFILPMLPFRLWLFGMARYLMRALMAILAAPIWAIAHLDPEGSGLGRRASHGYYMLLDLLLRPIVMVIGLLAGFAVIGILSDLFAKTFFLALRNALSGSHGGLVGMIVYLVLGAAIFVSLVNIAFGGIGYGMNFIFEIAGARTPHSGDSPEQDTQALDRDIAGSSQKIEGVTKQGASTVASNSRPVSHNQLVNPTSP